MVPYDRIFIKDLLICPSHALLAILFVQDMCTPMMWCAPPPPFNELNRIGLTLLFGGGEGLYPLVPFCIGLGQLPSMFVGLERQTLNRVVDSFFEYSENFEL